ncbi:SH3 domain-containing protein [uncultured Pseudoteredinibacter sp.]|uniref:SH3 domain-containing protein n=1 Tax=uncultured Pseudoteredinibacter sp. TaxID=1641701 RepID=UPI0026278FE4|nr:SH3 domain-containing protein [uncultured Pseudoteredinibacter sp.]
MPAAKIGQFKNSFTNTTTGVRPPRGLTPLYLLALTLVTLLTTPITTPKSQAAEYGVITANFVKVRQGPGSDYPGISQLNKGHVVTRLRVQGEWTEVSFINKNLPKGKQQRTGWMSSRYIKVDPVSNRPKRNKKTNAAEFTALVQPHPIGEGVPHQVKTKSLKVRSGPSTKHIRLSAIPFEHPVMVYNKDNGWARITTIDPNNDGKRLHGWVAAHFLKKDWATINALAKTKVKPQPIRGQNPKGSDPKSATKPTNTQGHNLNGSNPKTGIQTAATTKAAAQTQGQNPIGSDPNAGTQTAASTKAAAQTQGQNPIGSDPNTGTQTAANTKAEAQTQGQNPIGSDPNTGTQITASTKTAARPNQPANKTPWPEENPDNLVSNHPMQKQSAKTEPPTSTTPSFKDRLAGNASLAEPEQAKPSSATTRKRQSNPTGQPVLLTLEKELLACQRTDDKEVKACELTMRFALQGEPDITRAKVRCEADLLVGMAEGDPVRYPLNQEQIYKVEQESNSHQMVTTLEASGGDYNIRTVDLLSHRCAVTAFGRSKKN